MSEFKKGDWVKLVDADCIDRDAGLVNGAVGQVSGFNDGGSPIINFGGANHLMWPHQCVLISPAEAASVGDTVTVANSLWWPGGDRLVVGVDDNGLRDMRLAVIIDGRRRWVINRFVTALKRGADVKIAEAPKPEVAAPVDPEKPQTFIVVSDEGAALWPFKHKYDRRGSAEAEAGHRAMIKPGMKFTVYQAVTVVEAPKPGVSVVFLDKAV